MFDFDLAWTAHWALLGLPAPPRPELAALLVRWDEPPRRYHTLAHLQECLGLFDGVRGLARRPGEVALAIWFHDAVYEPRRHDNEAESAAWAGRVLRQAGAAADVAGRVEALVMATRHDVPAADDDARLVVDIDLAILGSDPVRYDEYARQVREEYGFVPEIEFRARRAEVLRRFLARPAIYATPALAARFEGPARVNLAREIDALA